MVCSCNNVTKGEHHRGASTQRRRALRRRGVRDRLHRAGTTCGSCKPVVKKIVEDHFAAVRARSVDRSLCEHFALTRQELFDLVAVHGYTRFDDLVEAHGTRPRLRHLQAGGRLDPGQPAQRPRARRGATGTLQDTNDAYLANIQRNGTYSVVPRIPGGEITPEKLIVIGEVARDFGLYTKITGGQRIDLFGARVEQLPRSGSGWSTPASSPATPTASRCAP